MSGLVELIESGRLIRLRNPRGARQDRGQWRRQRFYRNTRSPRCARRWRRISRLPPRGIDEQIAFVMSGGTEGVLSPHLTVFARAVFAPHRRSAHWTSNGSSIGIAHTRDFCPKKSGASRRSMRRPRGRAAMTDAAIADRGGRAFRADQMSASDQRTGGRRLGTRTPHRDRRRLRFDGLFARRVGFGRRAGARRAEGQAARRPVCSSDLGLFSSVASAFGRHRADAHVVDRHGQLADSPAPFVIGHAVMRDAIDPRAVADAFAQRRGRCRRDAYTSGRSSIFSPRPRLRLTALVRGLRHTMLDDPDIGSTRHARASVGGLIADLSGTGAVYVSGGADIRDRRAAVRLQ